ncbi:hypothetical protein LCGC14_1370960 [marine sediment metagenome]|uniref:Uncharacterized protein n=1 Tax=marine sediment metagenome TaxID=412755 RepID=A0A0F9KRE5_9ZZZZ
MYTAYVLDGISRDLLKKRFPPKYSIFVGHHITHEFGVDKNASLPERATVSVTGYVDDGEGLEALVVRVNRTTDRPDDLTYHITWSLNDGRKPVEANDLLKRKTYTLILPIEINATPTLLD